MSLNGTLEQVGEALRKLGMESADPDREVMKELIAKLLRLIKPGVRHPAVQRLGPPHGDQCGGGLCLQADAPRSGGAAPAARVGRSLPRTVPLSGFGLPSRGKRRGAVPAAGTGRGHGGDQEPAPGGAPQPPG